MTAKACDPADGPPCADPAHSDLSAPVYDTLAACCCRLTWVDAGVCAAASEGSSKGYFADYASGRCLRDCDPTPDGCSPFAPPPIALYDSIDACCVVGQGWVDYRFCTSRSIGKYSDGWVVDFQNEKCGESQN